MKFRNKEFGSASFLPLIFMLISLAFGLVGVYFYTEARTDWKVTHVKLTWVKFLLSFPLLVRLG